MANVLQSEFKQLCAALLKLQTNLWTKNEGTTITQKAVCCS